MLQLQEKRTRVQVELKEANHKVKQGEEERHQLQKELVAVAQTQQRQEEESTEQLKKELRKLQERLNAEVKNKNELKEASQSLKEVSGLNDQSTWRCTVCANTSGYAPLRMCTLVYVWHMLVYCMSFCVCVWRRVCVHVYMWCELSCGIEFSCMCGERDLYDCKQTPPSISRFVCHFRCTLQVQKTMQGLGLCSRKVVNENDDVEFHNFRIRLRRVF